METGSFILLLHSHIPYCKMAGTWPFGEEWLFEAMAETYIPILDFISKDDFFERQVGLTISFTPVLLEQMSDDYMKERFSDYLKMKISQAKGDHERFEGVREGRLSGLSEYYIGYYEDILKRYESELDRDVVKEVRRLQDSGRIEAITSAATHAYLPLFSDERSVREQISVGCETYERHMGKRPRGIWLPECGFKDDEGRWTVKALEDNGIEYFFVESHSVYPKSRQNAPSSYAVSSSFDGKYESCEEGERNPYRSYRVYRLKDSKLNVFVRNFETASQVWSKDMGYPGDGAYREFHRLDDVSGMRYWKVTNREADLGHKDIYNPQDALKRTEVHAEHFVGLVEKCLDDYKAYSGNDGVVVAPYDMELFGHWWFEGVKWLEKVCELMASSDVNMTTASRYLDRAGDMERPSVAVAESSWGQGGKHEVWMNVDTGWIWDKIHENEAKAAELYDIAQDGNEELAELAAQGVREFMLMCSSDWPFLITTGQAREYAIERFKGHLKNFKALYEAAVSQDDLMYDRDAEFVLPEDFGHVKTADSLFGWI